MKRDSTLQVQLVDISMKTGSSQVTVAKLCYNNMYTYAYGTCTGYRCFTNFKRSIIRPATCSPIKARGAEVPK